MPVADIPQENIPTPVATPPPFECTLGFTAHEYGTASGPSERSEFAALMRPDTDTTHHPCLPFLRRIDISSGDATEINSRFEQAVDSLLQACNSPTSAADVHRVQVQGRAADMYNFFYSILQIEPEEESDTESYSYMNDVCKAAVELSDEGFALEAPSEDPFSHYTKDYS